MVKIGMASVEALFLGSTEIVKAYRGTDVVYEAGTIDRGTGTIPYSWTNSERKIAVSQTSVSGSDSYAYNEDTHVLRVTRSS